MDTPSNSRPVKVLVVGDVSLSMSASRAARLLKALQDAGVEGEMLNERAMKRIAEKSHFDPMIDNIVINAPQIMDEHPFKPRGGRQYPSVFARPRGRPRR